MSGYEEHRLAANLCDPQVTFLNKPFRLDELCRALSRVLRAQPASAPA